MSTLTNAILILTFIHLCTASLVYYPTYVQPSAQNRSSFALIQNPFPATSNYFMAFGVIDDIIPHEPFEDIVIFVQPIAYGGNSNLHYALEENPEPITTVAIRTALRNASLAIGQPAYNQSAIGVSASNPFICKNNAVVYVGPVQGQSYMYIFSKNSSQIGGIYLNFISNDFSRVEVQTHLYSSFLCSGTAPSLTLLLYIFSGYNEITDSYIPDMLVLSMNLNTSTGIITSYSTPTTVSYTGIPRKNYASFVLDRSSVQHIFIYGGQNEESYLDDYIVFVLGGSNSFDEPDVRPDDVYGYPGSRAGHTFAQLVDNDPNVWYLHGGRNETHFFNDVWSLTFTINTQLPTLYYYSWKRLDDPENPAHRAIPGRAFHRSAPLKVDDITSLKIFSYGGILADDTPASPITFDVGPLSCYPCTDRLYIPNCLPLSSGSGSIDVCGNPPNSICTTYDNCISYSNCSEQKLFKCNEGCIDIYSNCPPRSPEYPCPVEEPAKCWDGTCADVSSNCPYIPPVPPCEAGQIRCNGGCKVGETCTPETCDIGETLCPDGSCVAPPLECRLVSGCLQNQVQCATGECKASMDLCENTCQAGNVTCWYDCEFGLDDCFLPYWRYSVIPYSTGPVNSTGGLFLDAYASKVKQKHVIVQLAVPNTNGALASFSMTPIQDVETVLKSIGPHPSWEQEFSPFYIRSVVATISTTGVDTDDPNTFLMFRMQSRAIDNSIAFDPNKFCLAVAVPWYWDLEDQNSQYPRYNSSYIQNYSNWLAGPENVNNVQPPTNLGNPAKRWKCISPNTTIPLQLANGETDFLCGCRLFKDISESEVAVITYTAPPLPPIVVPPAPAEPNTLAHYILLAVVGAFLLVLLIVVGCKAMARPS